MQTVITQNINDNNEENDITKQIRQENVISETEKKYISFDDFLKVEIQIGEIIEINEVIGSDKLYKLKVDFGESGCRIVFSGIKKYINQEDILNKQFAFITNLAPRKIMNEYSEAMILAGDGENILALLNPTQKLINGTRLH